MRAEQRAHFERQPEHQRERDGHAQVGDARFDLAHAHVADQTLKKVATAAASPIQFISLPC
jgi:hypothetical protein